MLPVWFSKLPEGSRLGFLEDLVDVFVNFACDATLFATGSNLIVDGGYPILLGFIMKDLAAGGISFLQFI